MAKHVALTVYEKFLAGDSIGNSELTEAVSFFKALATDLSVLGPVFRLAFLEANRTYLALDGFAQARAR